MDDKYYREKFDALGLSERFEFIGRDYSSYKGRKVIVRCRSCGADFKTWAFNEIKKGRASHLICSECGAASDGADAWTRSPQCDAAMAYYAEGHSVRETAEMFHTSVVQINNAVKARGVTNGRNWREEAAAHSWRVHKASEEAFLLYLKAGGADYKQIRDTHKRRAVKYKCTYDPTVTLKALIKRDGLRCAICGELCDSNDRTWGRFGPMRPTIDHIVPMSKGGGHVWSNVQIAHAICNSIKSNKEVSNEPEAENQI